MNACIGRLPASAFGRVPVLIDTTPYDSASAKILPSADILTQVITEIIRKPLGPENGPLADADSLVKWSQLGGSVIVTAHHDGTFTWRKDTANIIGFMGSGELDRIVNALSESAAAGERIFWPDSAKEDSLSYRLSFVSPVVRQDKKLEPVQVRVANPVFNVQMPWFKSAQMSREPRIDTPAGDYGSSSQNRVVLDFVVDTAGHIDPKSITEYVAPGLKPAGGESAYYRAWRNAVIRGLPTAEFKPASIAGCPIDQRVRQAFNLKPRQG